MSKTALVCIVNYFDSCRVYIVQNPVSTLYVNVYEKY